jgi:hypothetical protein
MRRELAQVRTDIMSIRDELHSGRQALAYDSIARTENTKLTRRDERLTPFGAYASNEEIPGFPRTRAEIQGLNGNTIDPILAAVELPTIGAPSARRNRLAVHIGTVEF